MWGARLNARLILGLTLIVASLLSGCAGKLNTSSDNVNDPWEPTNRKVFAFNESLDKHIMLPVAVFYRDHLPSPVRSGIHNFLGNLDMPVTIVNDALQARPKRFAQALGRVTVNTGLGLGGFFDVATKLGIPNKTADFGQTLGIYGVGEGPYIVWPFVGPLPPRDMAGAVGDHFFDPFTYANFRERSLWMAGRTTLGLLDDRVGNIDTVDRLRKTSIDFYATVRNLYRQDRDAKIHEDKNGLENLPDF